MSETKNILPYLEFHLTDHCNLNCKGCSHFCSIANENYLSMESFLKDMKRLSEIFRNYLSITIACIVG
jgi:molybdenum cofactor biosynthesis enzyme MoaA